MGNTSPSATSSPSRRYAWYVVGVLTLCNMLSVTDRFAFTLLLEPIKLDLGASDTEMSLLAGVAFMLFHTLFGLPIAGWIDRGDRRSIFAACVGVWSAATALCGFAASLVQMAVLRAGLGMGEAGAVPASLSLITDYFPKDRRAAAVGVFQSSSALTAILGVPLVGLVAEAYGWRAAFIALSVPGFGLALLLFFTVREPLRGAMDGAQPPPPIPLKTALMALTRNRPIVWLFAAQLLCGTGIGAISTWSGAFLLRVHGISLAELGAIAGPLYAPFLLAGPIAGAFAATRLAKRYRDDRWMLAVSVAAAMLSIPAMLALLLLDSLPLLLLGGALMNFFMLALHVPALTLGLELVPIRMRAITGSLLSLSYYALGFAIGPLVAGLISDALERQVGPATALRTALSLTGPVLAGLGAIAGLLAIRAMPAPVRRP